MRTAPRERHSLRVCFTRALTEGRVIHLVVHLMDIFREAEGKTFQRPDREPLWIDLTGHVPGHFASLSVASQLVEQLRCCRSKKTFHDGPKTRLLWWTIQFSHQTTGQQRLTVRTPQRCTITPHQLLPYPPVALTTRP